MKNYYIEAINGSSCLGIITADTAIEKLQIVGEYSLNMVHFRLNTANGAFVSIASFNLAYIKYSLM